MGLRDSFFGLFKRQTPPPADRKVYNIGIQEKDYALWMTAPILYHTAMTSPIVRTCITQLKNEIFRRGYILDKKFALKCMSCNAELQETVNACPQCGETQKLRKPNPAQKEYLESFLDESYCNKSSQLFIDVLKELEDDLNIMDDAYLVLVKEYFMDTNGKILAHRVKEMYRGDPVTMLINADKQGRKGHSSYTSVNDRKLVTQDKYDRDSTGTTVVPVHFVNRVFEEEQHFIEGEVLHFSKYAPSRLYGNAPLVTLWNHVTTLQAMENYVNTSYTKSRMPKGLLAVQTRNMESMKTFWKTVKEKMETDPHYIPVMGVEAEGKGSIEWVKFMDSLKEMEYISVKDDLRDRISAFYGVSKIFMADNSTSGGLNNEGMQILVTNRAVEMGQNVYNKYVFPWLCKQFGLTDWVLKLPPSEEEDEIATLRKREIEVNIAGQIKNLGFEVDMDDEGQFIYNKPEPKPQGEGGEGGEAQEDTPFEKDPYAGTDIDASTMGQLQEQALVSGGQGGGATPPQTRNKTAVAQTSPNRNTGLPTQAANNNMDDRVNRR